MTDSVATENPVIRRASLFGLGPTWSFSKLEVIDKREHRLVGHLFSGGAAGFVPERHLGTFYFVTLNTPHGECEIEVSRRFFERVSVGDRTPAKYRLRFWSGELKAKLVR